MANNPSIPEPKLCEYFVDEAGDPVLFNRRKKIVVGAEGCSNYFILGLAYAIYPEKLAAELIALRQQLLADPYLKQISQPDSRRGRHS